MGLPDEIIEAARMDGASDWRMYQQIAFPLTLSALAGVTVFTFLTTWNQFWWPLVIISNPEMRPITQAVAMASTSLGRRIDILVAGATIAVVPIIIVFALAMNQVVAGIAFSGSKEG
ncbi:MAG: carbohydrate ABC transporter permease, partial [Phototrophicaceae bacterium]